jgi:hypothetical protein
MKANCKTNGHKKTSNLKSLLITISKKMVVKKTNNTIEFKGTKYANSRVCRVVGGVSGTSQKSFI